MVPMIFVNIEHMNVYEGCQAQKRIHKIGSVRETDHADKGSDISKNGNSKSEILEKKPEENEELPRLEELIMSAILSGALDKVQGKDEKHE